MSDDNHAGESCHTEPEKPSVPPSEVSLEPYDAFIPITSFLKEHPAIIGTLIYIQVSTVGIVYIWTLLSSFGVNVFDYAEANDFLLAAFKQPLAYITGILTCIIMLADVMLLRYVRRKRGKIVLIPRKLLAIGLVTALCYTFLPAVYFGRLDARKIKQGTSGLISLKLKGKPEEVDSLLPKDKLSLIGTTDKFLFFYSNDCNKCVIVPVSNIGSLSFDVGSN